MITWHFLGPQPTLDLDDSVCEDHKQISWAPETKNNCRFASDVGLGNWFVYAESIFMFIIQKIVLFLWSEKYKDTIYSGAVAYFELKKRLFHI